MSALKFVKAESEQGFLKLGLYGKTGSGKTLTSLLIAERLAAMRKKRIAYVDTELGTEFYAKPIPERTVHPAAFDFDRVISRSMMEVLEAVESLDPKTHGVLVIDSITHLWEAAKAAYQGKLTSKGGIPIQAWQSIKKPYKRLMSLFLDGEFDAILCGREGVEMEEDENGEPRVVGAKMKSEGETPYEPHVLGRMVPQRTDEGGHLIRVFFEKDRSGILTGKTFENPTFETIAPVVAHLTGGHSGKLGTPEQNAERDGAAQDRAREQEEAERTALFEQIRNAVVTAQDVNQLKAAWTLTSGKKGKLGEDNFTKLEALKDARKSELAKVA